MEKEFLNHMKETDLFWSKCFWEKLSLRTIGLRNPTNSVMSVDTPPIVFATLNSYNVGMEKLLADDYSNAMPNERAMVEAVLPPNADAFEQFISVFDALFSRTSEKVKCSFGNGMREFARIIKKANMETKNG